MKENVRSINRAIDRKTSKKVLKSIRRQQLARSVVGVKQWTTARSYAESLMHPDNTELIRVYKDIEIDAHMWALMQTIRLKVIGNNFNVYRADGEIDDDATDKFKKKWFREVLKYFVDSDFYGHSLIQLGDVENGCFNDAEIVPREYVIQQKKSVKKSLGNASDLLRFDVGVFSKWLIPAGDTGHLGLLDKAAPLVIKKKEVIAAWSEAAELFGMPIRIGRTNIQDTERRANMEDMLQNIGEAAWAMMDLDDEIELKDTSKTDFSMMYDKFIERANSELSKLFLSQTGTTDEKSHVGAANVMENVLNDVVKSYVIRAVDFVNEKVMPLAVYHGVVPLGSVLKSDNDQKLTIKELFEIVKSLLPSRNIPDEWISETFGVPIEEDLSSNEEEQAKLRSSVGGIQALVDSILPAVADGRMTIDSAVSVVVKVYGFEEDVARKMVGNPAEIETSKPVEVKSIMAKMNKLYSSKKCC